MKEKLMDSIRLALQNNADTKTCHDVSRFFKKEDEAFVYGVKTAEVIKITKLSFTNRRPRMNQ